MIKISGFFNVPVILTYLAIILLYRLNRILLIHNQRNLLNLRLSMQNRHYREIENAR
jgi:hypothetical protein